MKLAENFQVCFLPCHVSDRANAANTHTTTDTPITREETSTQDSSTASLIPSTLPGWLASFRQPLQFEPAQSWDIVVRDAVASVGN
jgi:hypothetical protein